MPHRAVHHEAVGSDDPKQLVRRGYDALSYRYRGRRRRGRQLWSLAGGVVCPYPRRGGRARPGLRQRHPGGSASGRGGLSGTSSRSSSPGRPTTPTPPWPDSWKPPARSPARPSSPGWCPAIFRQLSPEPQAPSLVLIDYTPRRHFVTSQSHGPALAGKATQPSQPTAQPMTCEEPVRAGSPATSGGWSHSWKTQTSSWPAPRAQTISGGRRQQRHHPHPPPPDRRPNGRERRLRPQLATPKRPG
jgi:hypothetical protein